VIQFGVQRLQTRLDVTRAVAELRSQNEQIAREVGDSLT
jgi:hypothetical protein